MFHGLGFATDKKKSDKPCCFFLIQPWVCTIPGVSQLCQALEAVYDKLTPAIDLVRKKTVWPEGFDQNSPEND